MNPFLSMLIQRVPELLPVALMILMPVAAIFAWLRYRTGRMRLNLQATARLYKKVAGEALGDQLSSAAAFGFILHPRVLKMARERDDPLAFINSFKRARRYVRYESGRIVPSEGDDLLSFLAKARLLLAGSIVLLFLPWAALMAHRWLHFSNDAQVAIVLFQIAMWFITPAAVWVSDSLMHAHWLTQKFNERYPPAHPEPVLSIATANETAKPAVKRESKRARTPAS
ncbi:hypothetical protein ABU614_06700 [Lysobacter firmicutimachus]|uniref:Uncharacterized protein n=1 Tax=Lysobacter firmicutimachus TaxID=1792846 RepID=A0AAU8MW85_9GAMM